MKKKKKQLKEESAQQNSWFTKEYFWEMLRGINNLNFKMERGKEGNKTPGYK